MLDKKIYNEAFQVGRNELTRYAARKILNQILDISPISSVVDVGGGIGVWLDECKKQMGSDFSYGFVLDGNYIDDKEKLVNKDQFIVYDLENKLNLDDKFDLVICLEVAEHLSKERAEGFVEDLTKLGDFVLFSAAIPYQGGNGHINEQPVSYWIELFAKRGYEAYDIIRPNIYMDQNIPFWYRNNIMVYCNKNSTLCEKLQNLSMPPMYDIVTLDVYKNRLEDLDIFMNSRAYRGLSKLLAIINKLVKK